MSDLPEVGGDALDWTPEQCLHKALEHVKWMRENHPEGLEGVAVLFHYNSEFENRGDQMRFYLLSGMMTMEFVALCTRASYARLTTTYGNYEQ